MLRLIILYALLCPLSAFADKSLYHITVSFDQDLPEFWTHRYLRLLRSIPQTDVVLISPQSRSPHTYRHYRSQLVLSIGRTQIQRDHLPQVSAAAKPDSYALDSHRKDRIWFGFVTAGAHIPVDRGLFYGAYALLEELGFAFLHPLKPHIPSVLTLPLQDLQQRASPRWKDRGIHLHTQHPTELADFLNGWGREGPYDAEGWDRWFEAWENVCEWALANRLNRIQWALLGSNEWARFTDGKIRQDRLRKIVAKAQDYGLEIGIDAPLFLRQQNAFRLIRSNSSHSNILRELRKNLRYLMGTGIDYLMTELGTSEFTPGDEQLTLDLLNYLAQSLDRHFGGKFLAVKVHASAHQQSKKLKDPATGQPFNINFLPMLSDTRVVMMPHSVQYYSLKDPAPTYGQTSFDFLHEFIRQQAPKRKLWWHPETAYWVSFDIDVPLFLPIYAWKRLEDLELLVADEQAARLGPDGMGGQVFFSSGWEWGYWLQDFVTARSSYHWELGLNRADRLRKILRPLLMTLGDHAEAFFQLLLQTIQHQDKWLVWGGFPNQAEAALSRLNGQAYLQGFETWDDIAQLLQGKPLPQIAHQPLKYSPFQLQSEDQTELRKRLMSMLKGMRRDFEQDAIQWQELYQKAKDSWHPQLELLQEILHGVQINALRATFVEQLYEHSFRNIAEPSLAQEDLEQTAGMTLQRAAALIAERQRHYRLPVEDIAAWRKNPTVYSYTYLWTVRSLYYWWRDLLIVRDGQRNPCFLNIIDPIRTSGISKAQPILEDPLALLSKGLEPFGFEQCLQIPELEPQLPPP